MPEAPFPYDVIAYPGHVHPQMHPARLAAIARLHGVPAAPPSRCRLIEVGCGDAASLLPLALAYPESRFVGVDLSQEAIARGESYRTRLGLTNLTLAVADLTNWRPSEAPFDFVLAHGFYSWVPPAVRDALLALCHDHLASGGVAYVSYNALPGCHIRRMLWDMLRFHVCAYTDPAMRIEQSQALLHFLAAGAFGKHADILKSEARHLLDETAPSVLYHDDLSDINEPISITDFTGHAGGFGLQFLAEADYFAMHTDLLPEGVAGILGGMEEKSVVLKEQYLDYLKLRRFRQTLLCRAEVSRAPKPDPAVVAGLSAVCKSEASPDPVDLETGVAVQFHNAAGARVTLNHPAVKAAFVLMNEVYPCPLGFSELTAEAFRRGGVDADEKAVGFLRHVLVEAFRVGLVDLQAEPPRFARAAGARPTASPLALLQLANGQDLVTSLRPSVVHLASAITRALVPLLDGTRDDDALLNDLAARVAADPQSRRPDEPPRSPEAWRELLAPQIRAGLAQAAKNALLMET